MANPIWIDDLGVPPFLGTPQLCQFLSSVKFSVRQICPSEEFAGASRFSGRGLQVKLRPDDCQLVQNPIQVPYILQHGSPGKTSFFFAESLFTGHQMKWFVSHEVKHRATELFQWPCSGICCLHIWVCHVCPKNLWYTEKAVEMTTSLMSGAQRPKVSQHSHCAGTEGTSN